MRDLNRRPEAMQLLEEILAAKPHQVVLGRDFFEYYRHQKLRQQRRKGEVRLHQKLLHAQLSGKAP